MISDLQALEEMDLQFPEFRSSYGSYLHGKFLEIVQPLADLGYLEMESAEDKIASCSRVWEALLQFREELRSVGMGDGNPLLPYREIIKNLKTGNKDPEEEKKAEQKLLESLVDGKEMELLQKLVGLGGETAVLWDGALGGNPIWSRVINYRLFVFNYRVPFSYRDKSGSWVPISSKVDVKAMEELKTLLKLNDAQQIVDYLGDLPGLVSFLLDEVKVPKIVYFKEADPKWGENEIGKNLMDKLDVLKSKFRFLEKIEEERRNPEYRFYTYNFCNLSHGIGAINTRIDTPMNKFFIRVVQILLWAGGFYNGQLDTIFGKISFQGMNELKNTLNKLGGKEGDYDLFHFITHAEKREDYWAINSYLFFRVFLENANREDQEWDIFDDYDKEIETLKKEKKQDRIIEIQQEFHSEWAKANEEQNNNLKSSTNMFRRVYLGVKQFFTKVFSCIKDFFSSIKKFIQELVTKARNLIRRLYRKIREGVIYFARGIAFVAGKRGGLFETQGLKVYYRFDLDFDYAQNLQGEVTSGTGEAFCQHLAYITQTLKIALTVVTFVLTWGVALVTLNYPRLLIKIGSVFKDKIEKFIPYKS